MKFLIKQEKTKIRYIPFESTHYSDKIYDEKKDPIFTGFLTFRF